MVSAANGCHLDIGHILPAVVISGLPVVGGSPVVAVEVVYSPGVRLAHLVVEAVLPLVGWSAVPLVFSHACLPLVQQLHEVGFDVVLDVIKLLLCGFEELDSGLQYIGSACG